MSGPDMETLSRLLDATGRPVRPSTDCPRCGAEKSKRVASAGFGAPHDVCRECGYEWEGLTV
jgi:ribosomal protein L37AE/L43A